MWDQTCSCCWCECAFSSHVHGLEWFKHVRLWFTLACLSKKSLSICSSMLATHVHVADTDIVWENSDLSPCNLAINSGWNMSKILPNVRACFWSLLPRNPTKWAENTSDHWGGNPPFCRRSYAHLHQNDYIPLVYDTDIYRYIYIIYILILLTGL